MKFRLHYGWVVFAITFVALIVAAGVRSTPSILMVPLEHEFGWSRSTISFAVSINILLYGLMGPFAAALMNRFGVRRVIATAFLLIAAGVFATTCMTTAWQLQLLWGLVVGAGSGMVALVMGATVINRWFHTRRGLLMGILTASSATGQLVFLPLMAWIAQHHGWRAVAILMAVAAAIIGPLAFLIIRDNPTDLHLKPVGMRADEIAAPLEKQNPLADAMSGLALGLRSKAFYLLAGTFFICGASTNGLVGTHLVPACMDHGIAEVQAAGLLAVMGIFDLVGTTASGWMSDKFINHNRYLLFTYYGLRGLSLIYLPHALANGSEHLNWFAVFYGLDWIATVPPTLALTRQAFGNERATVMFGWIVAAHQIGAAGAAFGAGYLRSTEGVYDHAFYVSATLCIIAAIGCLFLRPKVQNTNELLLPTSPNSTVSHELSA